MKDVIKTKKICMCRFQLYPIFRDLHQIGRSFYLTYYKLVGHLLSYSLTYCKLVGHLLFILTILAFKPKLKQLWMMLSWQKRYVCVDFSYILLYFMIFLEYIIVWISLHKLVDLPIYCRSKNWPTYLRYVTKNSMYNWKKMVFFVTYIK